MSRTALIPARLAFTETGTPYSETFADVYHSAEGGCEQARHVFLAGNHLPERWRGRSTFTIVETGFGLGLNFLATWAALRGDAQAPARLHFVSVEKHPFSVADLETLQARWPEFSALSRELRSAWPPLIRGFHRLHLDDERITLTLLFGDAVELLPQLQAQADAFYLDGFAPPKNPDLWSPRLFEELARLATPDATLASYTVAGQVRNDLAAAGFANSKRRGFAQKRDMLVGWREGSPSIASSPARRAIVLGAGLAGTCCVERLAARGWQIDLIERHSKPAQEASANPAAILRPVLNLADTAPARLSRSAFAYTLQHLHKMQSGAQRLLARHSGVLQLAVKADEAARLRQIIAMLGLPDDFVRNADAEYASRLAGYPVRAAGCWFPRGASINAPELCYANLSRHAQRVTQHFQRRGLRLENNAEGWQVFDADDALITAAPVIVVANAFDCVLLEPTQSLPLQKVRGQLTYLPALHDRELKLAVSGNGYIAPLPDGGYCLGATFQHDDPQVTPRIEDNRENLTRLEALLPGFANGLDAGGLEGRVAYRATTPDRLPIFGAMQQGLVVATGLGARGLLWAPIGAELIAAQLEGEPLPVERELVTGVSPLRFSRNPH